MLSHFFPSNQWWVGANVSSYGYLDVDIFTRINPCLRFQFIWCYQVNIYLHTTFVLVSGMFWIFCTGNSLCFRPNIIFVDGCWAFLLNILQCKRKCNVHWYSIDAYSENQILCRRSGQRSRVRKLQYIAELERTVDSLQVMLIFYFILMARV